MLWDSRVGFRQPSIHKRLPGITLLIVHKMYFRSGAGMRFHRLTRVQTTNYYTHYLHICIGTHTYTIPFNSILLGFMLTGCLKFKRTTSVTKFIIVVGIFDTGGCGCLQTLFLLEPNLIPFFSREKVN